MRLMRLVIVLAVTVAVAIGMAVAQAPPAGGGGAQRGAPGAGGAGGGGGRGARGPVLSVTSKAWESGAEVPAKFAFGNRGGNTSPDFQFQWFNGVTPADPPANLQSYAIVFHDIENATRGGTADTLHWTAFNIPGTAKGIPEGMPAGDQPDGTRQGPGIRGGQYFGPGAGVGPFHHYVFEFFALDTKLDLPATATREQLMAAMEGHVVGKAAYVGRFRTPPPQQ